MQTLHKPYITKEDISSCNDPCLLCMSNDVDRPCCGQFDAKVGWPGHCKAASFTTLPNEVMRKGLQPHQQSKTPNDPSVTWLNVLLKWLNVHG